MAEEPTKPNLTVTRSENPDSLRLDVQSTGPQGNAFIDIAPLGIVISSADYNEPGSEDLRRRLRYLMHAVEEQATAKEALDSIEKALLG